MVASEPMPGSTPISVPTRTPIRHSMMLVGVAATLIPSARLPSRSNMMPLAGHENRGQSWNGRLRPHGNRSAQNKVRPPAMMTVSRQRASGEAPKQIA